MTIHFFVYCIGIFVCAGLHWAYLTTACSSLTNMAAGRDEYITWGASELTTVIDQNLAESTDFTVVEEASASCVTSDPGQWISWTVDLGVTSVISHIVLMVNHSIVDNDTMEVEVGHVCCEDSFSPTLCYNNPAPLHVHNVTSSAQLNTYDVFRLTYDEEINVTGRYVRVTLTSKGFATVNACGVKVIGCRDSAGLVNVALGKPATQSSQFSAGSTADLAVDGNKTQTFGNPAVEKVYCTHTKSAANHPHWWRVDLQKNVPVSELVIYNRVDCCHFNTTSFWKSLAATTTTPSATSKTPKIASAATATTSVTQNPLCKCQCVQHHKPTTSSDNMDLKKHAETAAKEIVQTLAVDTQTTGRRIRKRISAKDDRATAKMSGYVAVVLLSLVGVVLIGPDLVSAIAWLGHVLVHLKGRK